MIWRPQRLVVNLCLLVLVACLCRACVGALPAAVDAELDRVAPTDPPRKPITAQDVEAAYTEPEPPATTTFEATAYSYGCGNGDGLTATGTPIRPGVIAVDPAVIPYGSTVEIVGVGEFTAEDTGGAIRGNRCDIFMADRGDAVRWGRQTVEVRIVDRHNK